MSLTVALGNALSGLRTTETGLDSVSRNIANAGVDGYARRRVTAVESGAGGVRGSDVQRMLDTVVQRQMRTEAGAGAAADVRATHLGRLDLALGEPGGATGLDTLMNGLTGALQSLAAEPGNTLMRATVIAAGRALAVGLNDASATVQGLRGDAETELAGAVGEANAALEGIASVERDLALVGGGHARADLLDQRDRLVDRLSQLVDIRVTSRGDDKLSIVTAGGVSLYNGAASRLSFDARAMIGPTSTYARDPAQSGVGQVTVLDPNGGRVDITEGNLRGGEIAGLLRLRDQDLPAMQTALDSAAAGLATATQSDPAMPAMFVDAGNGVAAALFAGGTQQAGFAARIALNPALAAVPASLVGAAGPARPQALLTALTHTPQTFTGDPAQGAAAQFTGPLDQFMRRVLDSQAGNAATARNAADGQRVVVNALSSRFAETSGVSVDEELAHLSDLQNTYAANARIVSTVNAMFDALMNI